MVIWERNWKKTCLSVLLAVVCLMTSLLFLGINARAVTVIRTGTVTADSLRVRSGPGTVNTTTIGFVSKGDQGQILEEGKDSDGDIWYKWTINGITGWSASWYIDVKETIIDNDGDFEGFLTAQGFPESYKEQLRVLHTKYPNWVFQAQQTNLTWSEVIEAESKLGKNLVHGGADTSWKSTQNGAYNWETGQWVEFDSGGWVAASTEIIQYFMDPRNFLDETSVFQFLRQSYNAAEYDEAGLKQIKTGLANQVKNTFLAGNCDGEPYTDVIMRAAAAEGVSPYVLASMIIQEIGVNGDSGSISGKVPGYEGYYNYFNVGAFASGNLTAIQKGLQYAKGTGDYGRPWNTRYKAIAGGAEYYASGYIKKGQDTMYLKKFNVQGSNLYGHQYMTNVQGAYSEGRLMAKAYDETARQGALVFRIPVYKNMPDKPCVKPTGNSNPNYMLRSLSVAGYDLTPTFSMHETSYDVIVPNSVGSVTISASTLATTTKVSGTGSHNLNVGSNVIKVTTTAQNGTQKVYTITVVRQAAATPEPPKEPEPSTPVIPTPSVSSTAVKVNSDNTLTGVKKFPMSVNEMKNALKVTNGTVTVVTANGTAKTGNVGTGDKVIIKDNAGKEVLSYTVVVYGDTNGDGEITALDLLRVQKDILSMSKLSGYYSKAADTDKDGKIGGMDLLQVKKHILQMKQIGQ